MKPNLVLYLCLILAVSQTLLVADFQPTPIDLNKLKANPSTVMDSIVRVPSLPFNVAAFETPETKEGNDISNQIVNLFQLKQYDQLEAITAKYRSSKERDANGHWKLNLVYNALHVPDDAPDPQWQSRLNDLQHWIDAKPESITARVALTEVLILYAWKARGNGYANTVSDEGEHLFEQRLGQAANVLINAKNLTETCPHYHSAELHIGLAEASRSQFDRVFSKATKDYPEYESYYVCRATYLLPRWYGNTGEWESDLAKSADQLGGTNGDILYAQVVWDMHNCFDNIFTENHLSWPRVNRGFEMIENRFPNSFAAKSEHADLAAMAGDKPVARKYLDLTGGKVDLSVWYSIDDYTGTANYVYLAKDAP